MALYRHVIRGSYPGEVWTFSVHTDGTASLAAAQTAWMDGLTSFFNTTYLGMLCTDVVAVEASTAELDQQTGKQLTKAADPRSDTGTSTAACLPFQITPVVTERTAFAGRGGNGRFYTPSLAVDQQAAGRLTATAQQNLLTAANGLYAGLTGAGLTPVVYSTTFRVTRPVTALSVGDVLDTQRRRRNKLTENRISAVV